MSPGRSHNGTAAGRRDRDHGHHDGKKLRLRGKTRGGGDVDVTLYGDTAHQIGSGAFGRIFKIQSRVGDRKTEYVALKEPKYKDDDDGGLEAELLKELSHPNMLDFKFEVVKYDSRLVATELITDGDLFKFITDRYDVVLGLGIYVEVFGFQMYRGLGYLHSRNIVHRDVKPENLLVSESTGLLKIADFGCAKRLVQGRGRDSCCVGTKEFRAPELLLHSKRTTPMVDVWSAAVVMTEMVAGKPIFGEGPSDEEDQLMRIAAFLGMPHIMRNKHTSRIFTLYEDGKGLYDKKDLEEYCSEQASLRQEQGSYRPFYKLLKHNLRYKPQSRMTAYDTCADRFFELLFDPLAMLPNGNVLPRSLFAFKREEFDLLSEEAKVRLSSHLSLVSDDYTFL